MATRSLGTLTLDLVAKIGGLTAGMSQAEREVEKRTRAIRGHLDKLRTAFSWFAGAVGVAGIGAAIKSSIELGDQLNKAAIKAGVSGKAISELAHAAKMADVDIGALSTSLRMMQTNLSQAASGGKGPIESLRALGLTIDQLRGLGADRQFEIIGQQISRLKDPADKARVATELFGRAGADLLPLFEDGAEGIRKAREEAQKLGVSFSDQQVKKLAEADDAIKRLRASWEGFATALTAKVAPALTAVFDMLSGANRSIEIERNSLLLALQKQLSTYQFKVAGSPEEFAQFQARVALIKSQIERLRNAPLTEIERSEALRGRAGAVGGDAPGFAIAQEVALTEIIVENAKIRVDAMEAYYQSLDDASASSTEKQIRHLYEIESALDELFSAGRITADQYNERWTEALENVIEEVEVTSKRIGEIAEKPFDLIEEYAKQAARNIQDTFADFLFDPFKDGLKGMLVGFINTLRRMVAEAAAAKILGGVNLAGGLGGLVGNLLGFAGGGRPPVGAASIVGERGPELFIPDTAGTIVPNHRLGGNVTINVDARGAQEGVAKQLAAVLPAVVREAVNQSRSAVMSDLDRRGVRFA